MGMTRRQFLGSSGAAVVAGAMARNTAFGANDRVNIAMIGCGFRGRMVTGGLMSEGAQLTYLCDLRQDRMDDAWAFLSHEQETAPKMTKDMNEVFASDEVDAVVVSTPDHWHALPTIRACQAGKDVFVEKIHSHNIFESMKVAEAAMKHGRIVQVGTQCRSAEYVMAARDRIAEGALGDVALVKVYNAKSGGAFHLGEPEDPPEGFDWNTWVGRTPKEWPYYDSVFRHGYHHFWDFNGGDMAGDGIHQIDMALMLLGDPGLPKSVRCIGGRFVYGDDDSERPDVQVATWEFDNCVVSFDLTGYPAYMRKTDGSTREGDNFPDWATNATRIELYGSNGLMYAGRHGGGWVIHEEGGEPVESMAGRVPDIPHAQNFLECIRTREQPTANPFVAHPSNVMVHMANIAHRMGNISLNFDSETQRFNSTEANTYIDPPSRDEFRVPRVV